MQALLFTEDDNIYLQLLKLESQPGQHPIQFTRGKTATLAAAPHQPSAVAPDAVLVDSRMVEQHGPGYLPQIRAAAQNAPVVLLAGSPPIPDIDADAILHLALLDSPVLATQLHQIMEYLRLKKTEAEYLIFSEALKEATRAINSTAKLPEVLDRVLRSIQKAIPHDAANIMVIEGDMANIVHLSGYDSPLRMAFKITDRPDLLYILEGGQPLLITDTASSAIWHKSPGTDWIRGYLGTPLRLRGQTLGFLNLDSRTPGAFTPTQAEWLEIFAEQISCALYSTRQHHSDAKRRQEIETLQSLIELVGSTLDLDSLIEMLLRHLLKVVPYDTVSVLLMDGEHLEIVASHGFAEPDRYLGQRIEPHRHAALNELVRTRQPITASNIQSDPRFNDLPLLAQKHSWLGIPLVAQGIFIGCMIMESNRIGAYGKAETILVSSFANQAAMAIHNAQLYEELRRYANELEARVASRTEELVRANTRIKQNEQRFRALFEATFEGIVVHDQGMVLETNTAFQTLLGYTPTELIGKSILDLVTPESRALIQKVSQSGSERPYETIGLRKNGSTFHAEILGKQIQYEGQPVRMAAVRDLTERIEKEQRELDLTLERERTQILTNFITQASHEFRTPLTIISINAQMMKRLVDDENIGERAEIIKDQVTYISQLISNMVNLSILDNNQQGIDFRRTSLDAIIDSTRQTALAKIKARQQNLIYRIEDRPLDLWGNVDYLQQAISQLIDNATNHTPTGGTITVRAFRQENDAVIEVSDTGSGISSEHLPNIFERFYRVDKAGTTRGFGLGLSLVQVIVSRHGGRIEVETEVNQGSTFRIHLPTAF